MGICFPCFEGGASYDDNETQETRRQNMAAAAMKRQENAANRGIKDPASVKRKQEAQKRLDEEENKRARMGGGDGENLRWNVD
ncbi:uncharacterized protein LOC117327196 [Pecten maximus]|uniref:uncharacterized protein LOC117327196 n=1 Tax=Pecten maximus TaxID=6579 RepID=UPI00145828F8|nr:uncharacterized protein LOC117327196 [Pecten maximus]